MAMNPAPGNTAGNPHIDELSPAVSPAGFGDFRYSHGDRPLDGYTIQRGIGRGGFGEVYYAISDSGREVALKALVSHEQIELRGIGQCMNLKSPHLVSIFDVRRNALGRSFVIMEYVRGANLQQILSEAPAGLGPQKAAFFLREIAKGLTYLHDCGVVHRDLKPGNIFYEDGYVKICDYGLAKAMSESVNSGQTTTVGTVHYMAPEIGVGRYDKSIDIYALGVILYEMLTGQVPFLGQSPAEVIAKHLSAQPDLSGIEEPFATAIRRAMAKDVDERYRSVQEMVEGVFGSEHIRMSVSHFRPESLSMAAERVAARVKPGAPTGGSSAPPPLPKNPRLTEEAKARPYGWADRLEQRIGNVADRASERVKGTLRGGKAATHLADAVEPQQRLTLALITAGLMGIAAAIVAGDGEPVVGFMIAFGSMGGALALRWARGHFGKLTTDEEGWLPYLTLGGSTAIGAIVPAGMVLMASRVDGEVLGAVGATLLITNWNERTRPDRDERFSVWHAIGWGFCAFLMAQFFDADRAALVAASLVAATSLVAQVLSPFHPLAGGAPAKEEEAAQERDRGVDLKIKVKKEPKKAQPKAAAFAASDAPTTIDPPAAANSTPVEVSSRRNLIALILCAVPFVGLPFAGLHRFYAGKIGTGILWLLTGGLFLIGQIVDLIMILCSEFRDAEGRPIKIWLREEEVTSAPAAMAETKGDALAAAPRRTIVRSPGLSIGSILCSLGGTLMLLGAFVLGLMLAVNLPAMLAAIPDVQRDMNFGLGEDWQRPMYDLGVAVAGVLGLLGVMLLMIGRSRRGIAHMLRPIPAAAMFGICLAVVSGAFDRVDWFTIFQTIDEGRGGLALRHMLDDMYPPMLIPAGVLLLTGIALLLWPPRPMAVQTTEGMAS